MNQIQNDFEKQNFQINKRAQQIEWTLGVGRVRALMSQTNNEVWWVDGKIEKVNK